MAWWVLLVACSGSGGDRCAAQAECEGLDEAAEQSCRDGVDAAIESAGELGCGGEQAAMQTCLGENGECDESGASPVYRVDSTSCADEQAVFSACVSG